MNQFLKWGLTGLSLVLLIAAVSSGSALLYFLFSSVFMLRLMSDVMIRYYKNNIYVIHSVNSKMLYSGESLAVDYRVYNSCYLPMLNVEIEFDMDKKIKQSTSLKEMAVIAAQDYLPFVKNFTCPYRGYYNVGKVKVTLHDPLMIHKRVVTFEKPIEVIVRPKIKKLRPQYFVPKDAYGTLKSNKKTLLDDTNIAGIRPYAHGDALKNIHWKISAKNDELLTKVYDDTIMSRLILVLDAYKGNFSKGMDLKLEEEMVSFCLSLIYDLIESGIRVRLMFSGKESTSVDVDGMGDFDKILDLLTHFESVGNHSIHEVLEPLMTQDRVVVITPYLTRELMLYQMQHSEIEVYSFKKNKPEDEGLSCHWIEDIMDVTYEI